MTEETDTEKQAQVVDERQGKKMPYQTPVLIRWGGLRNLTMAVGRVGAPDWGHGRNRYTGRGGLHKI
ncbi:MAG: hypothetical protein JSR90_22130 [Proteobacteria bacterium]|nr:hypothetical protein [Pseudomonadota bacterium]